MRVWFLVGLLSAGCDGGPTSPRDLAVPDLARPPLCDDSMQGDAGIPATFENVQKLFDDNCANDACHGRPDFMVQGGIAVWLARGHAYGEIVNRMSKDLPNQCGGNLVTPGDPAHSFLMVKLTTPMGQQCNPQGSEMPIGEPFFRPLDDCLIDVVRRWILAGAPP